MVYSLNGLKILLTVVVVRNVEMLLPLKSVLIQLKHLLKKLKIRMVIYIHIMRLTTQITILKLKYIVPYMGLFGKNLGFIPVDIIVLTAQAAVLNL